jgi:hypothetical protein
LKFGGISGIIGPEANTGRMSEKMPEPTKLVLINVYTIAVLIWCYFNGYSLTAILVAGFMLLGVVNIAICLRRR